MTVTTQTFGYLEDSYLEGPYLTNTAIASAGMQSRIIIESREELGFQAAISIIDSLNAEGLQVHNTIVDRLVPKGMQASITINEDAAKGFQALVNIINAPVEIGVQAAVNVINSTKTLGFQAEITIAAEREVGMQVLANIIDSLEATGFQYEGQIVDKLRTFGFEARIDRYPTSVCPDIEGYLEGDYLSDPYLTEIWCTRPGMQAAITIQNFTKAVGQQARITIVDTLKTLGMQSRIQIVDYRSAYGMQADIANQSSYAFQALATIYNTSQLRVLCEFPSRGLTASNWSANSTMAGDFSVQNLDTDVVEQVWRSNSVTTGVRITTDTGLPQGVFLDTLAILGHNMTRSADVVLLGSNDPTFTTIGVTIPLEARLTNIFYIAPDLPTAGYRYWRFDIDDPTNPHGYIEIGTIIFGAADIFQGECFVDELEFELKDYADTVRTEGFTNVANSRSQKRRIRLDFRSLSLQERNFEIMREMFERDRTINKCLWIPTPSATLQDVTARFAVFGKLAVIPTERHNNKGPNHDYVTFTIDVDESL